MYCDNCGTKLEDNYDFCPECGNKVSRVNDEIIMNLNTTSYKVCKNCGESMPEDAFYCFSCGTLFDLTQNDMKETSENDTNNINAKIKSKIKTNKKPSEEVWKNKWVALLLCLFLGMFGVHRFYEEKKITGLLYVFTFGFFGMGVLIDFILILTKPNPYRVK